MKPCLAALRYRLEYFGFLLVAGLFRGLPIERASALSGKSWRLIAPFTSRHQRAKKQLQRAFPAKTPAECDAIAREMWETMGRTFGEFFHLDEIAPGGRIVVDDDTAELKDAAPGAGFVACAAHQANWEIAVRGLPLRTAGAAGVYQRIKNPFVDAYVRRLREKFYPGGLFEKHASISFKLMRHVRGGGGVTMMADLRDSQGVKVPFFGLDAPSTPFPAMMARSLDAPLYAATIVREPGARFRLRLDPVEVPRTADRDADIARATANLNAAFEASIRRRPEQWMWAHRRWG